MVKTYNYKLTPKEVHQNPGCLKNAHLWTGPNRASSFPAVSPPPQAQARVVFALTWPSGTGTLGVVVLVGYASSLQ